MSGTVLQVSLSRGGVPKLPVLAGQLTEAGVAGDSWRYRFHGGPRQAILLITVEGIDELVAQGFPLFPGALGENLTIRGIARRALQPGRRLQAGEATVELTKVRIPCAAIEGTTMRSWAPATRTAAIWTWW